MAKNSHLDILSKGTDAWNQWRDENPDVIPDLTGANLKELNLREIDLCDANLNGANLRKAILVGAFFINASLEQADFTGAYLNGATFKEAELTEAEMVRADLSSVKFNDADLSDADLGYSNLKEADFSGADLFCVNLSDTDLYGAIFTETNLLMTSFNNAKCAYTIFGDVDLSVSIGVENIVHEAPSTIGIDAIYRSKGNIPKKFLEEAGIPQSFITKLPSLLLDPKIYYSCFISYSSRDEVFASILYKDLKKEGVRVWYAPSDMKIGKKLRQTIDKSIKSHDKLLLILSKDSIESQWVEKEVETAFEEERTKRSTILFPIRLDGFVMQTNEPWAADIRRTRNIGDFSDWRNGKKYKEAFKILIESLEEIKVDT